MTESTASAIMSLIGSASHCRSACSAPHFLSAARLRIVSCPPLTLRPGGSGLPSRSSSSFLTTASSAGSSFLTAPFLPFAGDAAAFFLPRVALVGDAGSSSASAAGSSSFFFFSSSAANASGSGLASGSHEDTVWIPSKSASSANRNSPSFCVVGTFCLCVSFAVLRLVYS